MKKSLLILTMLSLQSCFILEGLPLRPALFPVKIIAVEYNTNKSGKLYMYTLQDRRRNYFYHSDDRTPEELKLGMEIYEQELTLQNENYKI